MFSDPVSQFRSRPAVESGTLQLGSRTVPLLIVRNPRARRYLLRVRPDGSARVTIPRGGNPDEARSFLERHRGWLAQQIERLHSQPRLPVAWQLGSPILFRGEWVRLESDGLDGIRLGTENLKVPDVRGNLRPAIERHLRQLAARELPVRLAELAARHQSPVQRVVVRNQRSRWGSCSRRGTVSLNWRLIQTPDSVRDYILLHELAHLRQMNHSDRFWREVAAMCPTYQDAERWLKVHRRWLIGS